MTRQTALKITNLMLSIQKVEDQIEEISEVEDMDKLAICGSDALNCDVVCMLDEETTRLILNCLKNHLRELMRQLDDLKEVGSDVECK